MADLCVVKTILVFFVVDVPCCPLTQKVGKDVKFDQCSLGWSSYFVQSLVPS